MKGFNTSQARAEEFAALGYATYNSPTTGHWVRTDNLDSDQVQKLYRTGDTHQEIPSDAFLDLGPFLTTDQAADRLGVTPEAVRLWCRNGKLSGAVAVGPDRRKVWLIPPESLEGVTRDPRGWQRGRPRKEME